MQPACQYPAECEKFWRSVECLDQKIKDIFEVKKVHLTALINDVNSDRIRNHIRAARTVCDTLKWVFRQPGFEIPLRIVTDMEANWGSIVSEEYNDQAATAWALLIRACQRANCLQMHSEDWWVLDGDYTALALRADQAELRALLQRMINDQEKYEQQAEHEQRLAEERQNRGFLGSIGNLIGSNKHGGKNTNAIPKRHDPKKYYPLHRAYVCPDGKERVLHVKGDGRDGKLYVKRIGKSPKTATRKVRYMQVKQVNK